MSRRVRFTRDNRVRRGTYRPWIDGLEDRCLLDAALLPGDLTLGPAAGLQNAPQIARGDNQYLAVWQDNRTQVHGQGTMYDIYAARLDLNGNLIDTTPFVLSQDKKNQAAPQVAWNGQNWLVAWQSQVSTSTVPNDIAAIRVSPEGSVLDATPIVVQAAVGQRPGFLWTLASDGANWVAVWQDLDPTGLIYTLEGARIAPDGTVLDPAGKVLRQDTTNSYPTHADLAFAGDEYLLTWIEIPRGANPRVLKGQRLTPALDPLGPLFTVNVYGETDRSTPGNTSVATNGTDFFVTWFENRYYGFAQVFGTRVSHAGQVLDPNGLALTPYSAYTQFLTDVAWNGTNWVAVYNKDATGGEDVYATRVESGGTVLDPNGRLVVSRPGMQGQPALAVGTGGDAQVIWTDGRSGTSAADIYAATLQADGAAGADSPVSLAAPRQTRPRMVVGENGFLAVFRSETSSEVRILAQRLDASGNAIDAEPLQLARGPAVLPSGQSPLANPAVAWNGSVYLVIWEASGQIHGRRVSPDGTALDAGPFTIMPGTLPDVAALGDTFLVVDAHAPSHPHDRYTFAVRVDGNGSVLGSPVRLGLSIYAQSPRAAALGGRWLVIWEQDVTHDNTHSSIMGAFLAPDGTAGANFFVGRNNPYADSPHVAVSGESALVVWADGLNFSHDIRGRIIHADGTLEGPAAGFAITYVPQQQLTPAVAWDGSQYLVTWLDYREDAFPDNQRGDIYAARVTVDGVVLDPDGFPLATSVAPEVTPFVAAANGVALFAYSGFIEWAPYATLRIVAQPFFYNVAAQFYVWAPEAVLAGQPFDFYVFPFDSYWNWLTDYTGTVAFFTTTDPGAVLPGEHTFTAEDGGWAYFPGGATFFAEGWNDLWVYDTTTYAYGAAWILVTGDGLAPGGPGGRSGEGMTVDAADTLVANRNKPRGDLLPSAAPAADVVRGLERRDVDHFFAVLAPENRRFDRPQATTKVAESSEDTWLVEIHRRLEE